MVSDQMPENFVQKNLTEVRAHLDKALARAGREAGSVNLMAVSKRVPADIIREALAAGHRLFGENKIQEAENKWRILRAEFPDTELHLIGALQSNKAKQAIALFDALHSLDRLKLVRVLADEIQKQGRHPKLFIQVNTGGEPQKSGVLLDELDDFVASCRTDYGLEIAGLMCLPPVDAVPAPHFALLEKRAQNLGLSQLSMGMSGDYEAALPFGTNYIRLGTAIFGPRN